MLSVGYVTKHPIKSIGLNEVLSRTELGVVRWTVPDLQNLLSQLEQSPVDVLVMDVDLNHRTPLGYCFEHFKQLGKYRKILLVNRSCFFHIRDAIHCRFSAVIDDREPIDQIVEDFRNACSESDSELTVSKSLDIQLSEVKRQLTFRGKSTIEGCSPQQIELLVLLASGASVKQVAQWTNQTEKAVDSHKSRIMNRMNVKDRAIMSLDALKLKLIDA